MAVVNIEILRNTSWIKISWIKNVACIKEKITYSFNRTHIESLVLPSDCSFLVSKLLPKNYQQNFF